MGRPMQFDRDDAVDTIMNEVWKHGLEAATAKALAERIGVTRSSFYNAFDSRDRALEEAVGRYLQTAPDSVLATIGPDDEVLPVITALFRSVCRLRADDPDAKGCMAINCLAAGDAGSAARTSAEKALERGIGRLEMLLQQACRNGEMDDCNAHGLALAIKASLIGLNIMSRSIRSEEELWAAARQMLTGLGIYRP